VSQRKCTLKAMGRLLLIGCCARAAVACFSASVVPADESGEACFTFCESLVTAGTGTPGATGVTGTTGSTGYHRHNWYGPASRG